MWRMPLFVDRKRFKPYFSFDTLPACEEIDWRNVGISFLDRLITGTTSQRLRNPNFTHIEYFREPDHFKILRKIARVPFYGSNGLKPEVGTFL